MPPQRRRPTPARTTHISGVPAASTTGRGGRVLRPQFPPARRSVEIHVRPRPRRAGISSCALRESRAVMKRKASSPAGAGVRAPGLQRRAVKASAGLCTAEGLAAHGSALLFAMATFTGTGTRSSPLPEPRGFPAIARGSPSLASHGRDEAPPRSRLRRIPRTCRRTITFSCAATNRGSPTWVRRRRHEDGDGHRSSFGQEVVDLPLRVGRDEHQCPESPREILISPAWRNVRLLSEERSLEEISLPSARSTLADETASRVEIALPPRGRRSSARRCWPVRKPRRVSPAPATRGRCPAAGKRHVALRVPARRGMRASYPSCPTRSRRRR